MTTRPTPDWLELYVKDPLEGYCDHFGRPFPCPEIVKFAPCFGGMSAIKQLLIEHVLADQPVTDWSAFALELERRARRHKPN